MFYTVRIESLFMRKVHTIILILATWLGIATGFAYEVYHWVDENGVAHYSQDKPDDSVKGVKKLQLEDTTPAGFDPTEDRYGVEQQAERMAELRENMDERREAARERRQSVPPAPVPIYQDPYPYSLNRLWLPPVYPWPPVRPEPPIDVPYRTATLAPPGR
jgi:hypothetical protein